MVPTFGVESVWGHHFSKISNCYCLTNIAQWMFGYDFGYVFNSSRLYSCLVNFYLPCHAHARAQPASCTDARAIALAIALDLC